MTSDRVVRIFTVPQEFPCGPGSTCCGPIGQSAEELRTLTEGLEKALNVKVAVFDVKDGMVMRDHRRVLALLRSFGWGVLPVIALDEELIAMGMPTPEEAANLIKVKLGGIAAQEEGKGVTAFEYGCVDCGEKFDLLDAISREERGASPACPRCGGAQTVQLFGGIGFLKSNNSSPDTSFRESCGCGSDPRSGCCG